MKKLISLLIVALIVMSASAQEERQLKSYHYFEAQGGVQMPATDENITKLISPTVALSYGYMTPKVGTRLHINGWQSKLATDYKFKYVDLNADLLLNVTSIFSHDIARPLNLYLLGGFGHVSTFDYEDEMVNQSDKFSFNLRTGLRLETNITSPLGISLEVNGNYMPMISNNNYNNSKGWGFTAMLGVSYRFGHKYEILSKPMLVEPVKLTKYQMMTNSLKEKMDSWIKRMPNESLEAYQLRVNDKTRAAQALNLEYEISTMMATDMLETSQISYGDYNPVLKKLAVHVTSMPDFYLDMDEKEAASFYGTSNLQLRNQKYTLHPDDSFELVYAEVYNPSTGKTYTFDNLKKMSLNDIRNDANYLPLSVLSETMMKETRLSAIMDDMVNLAKDDHVITDHTHISVNSNVELGKDAAGQKIMNYNVNFAYEVEEQFSARDDYKPGRYITSDSKAAILMLQIMKKAFDQDFNKYLAEGKKVVVKITGTADASPINRALAYDGRYGEYNGQSVMKDGQAIKLSLTSQEGIATNEQLAFVRALGVKDWIEKEITDIQKMQRDYLYQIGVSTEKGSKYRRISVQYSFIDAF